MAAMKTYGDLFTGFGGATLGAIAAGLTPLWGNELDPAIAEVGNYNLGGHIRVGDVLEQNPRHYERVDVLHCSPPCVRASVANSSAEVNEDGLKESPLDIALASKCIEFIETLQPEVVTLENVWAYRKFQSWQGGRKCEGIQSALHRLGYWVSVEHVNFANFGVPQTRKRMIVRAIRGGFVPYLPQPVKWVGWYEAISDILHTLPDSQFAPWQLARLPNEIKLSFFMQVQGENGDGIRLQDEPAQSITSSHIASKYRAFLVGKNQDKFGDGIRYAIEPAQTIGANEHGSKAFLVDCQNAGNPSPDHERGLTIRAGDEPCFTLTSSMGQKRPTRAYDGVGRVVAMTARALARFQSFPGSYILPDSKTLAAKGIGNAVSPLAYQRIMEGLQL